MTYTYQWERCDATGANCVDIAGETSANHINTSADVGHTLRGRVTDGVNTVTSAPSAVIAAQSTTPNWRGPWMSPNGPWRKLKPANVAIHPLSPGMVQDEYTGFNYDSNGDIHAWAYAPTQMQAKWGTAGLTYMKWAGPGGVENVIYSPIGQSLTKVWIDFPTIKGSYAMVPFPSNWTGYDHPTFTTQYYERRTVVVCEGGDVWVMYQPSPPGVVPHNGGAADGDWHATTARQIGNIADETWDYHGGGGSGIPHGCGLITMGDVIYARTHGDFGHAIAINTNNAADGSFAGIPMGVYPALKGYAGASGGPNTDGRTKTNAGIPHGGCIMLDPNLTDSDLGGLFGLTKQWQFWFAHTFQRYGSYSKESTTGQGGAGGFMCETQESIAWNISQGYYPSGSQYDWVTDGTIDTSDIDNSTYNGAFPPSMMPQSNSHWRVVDYSLAIPGINAP